MLGTKEICALLLAGGMGAGSVVGVQHVKPAVHKAVARRAPVRPAPVAAPAPIPAPRAALNDCPAIASSLGSGIADLVPLPAYDGMGAPSQFAAVPFSGIGYLVPGIGAGGGGGALSGPSGGGDGDGESTPSILPPVSGVPQPASWAMMVAGFGFVGLALRKGVGAKKSASDIA